MPKQGKAKRKPAEVEAGLDLGIGGMLKGLAGLVEKLGELAETGEELSRTGEIRGSKKGARGIYGFTVKVGLGDETTRVEPFGNIRKDEKTGRTVVQEIREPVVDIFDEQDHTVVVAEMPGITEKDVQLEVEDDLLTISAARGDKKYRKEVLLPHAFLRQKMLVSCNNGVLEIKCVK